MKTLTTIPCVLILWFTFSASYAQEEYYDDYYGDASTASEELVRNSEFNIPSTPAFSLLGVTPEMVTRPGVVQDFKVDWRIKNYTLAPDLALEAQPFWVLYYDRKGLNAYRKASPLMKTLSTLSVSFGTAKMDGLNHFAYSLKLNLYREKDPISDSDLIQSMALELANAEAPIKEKIEYLKSELDTAASQESRLMIREEIYRSREDLSLLRRDVKRQLIEVQHQYMQENWNSDAIDFAFGRVSTFNNDLDSLNIEKAGVGIWVNGAKGIGRNGLLTGITKLKFIGENTDFMLGASYRFGGYRFSFYGELVYENLQNHSDNGFSEEELFAYKYERDLGNGWTKFDEALVGISQWNITYGGDFRLSNGILLNFSLRTRLDQNLKFKRFLPVANITCLMR